MLHRLVSRARVSIEKPALLVLLHGLGSNETDLFSFVPDLSPSLTVVSLRAPREYGNAGYAWFDVDWTDTGLAFRSEQAEENLALLLSEIKGLQTEFSILSQRTIVGGFSQGAMMALGLLLRHPHEIGGGMVLSGCLVPGFSSEHGRTELPVFQSHGRMDPIIPVGLGRQARDLLIESGFEVEYHEYPMAHEVDAACLRDAANWVADQI